MSDVITFNTDEATKLPEIKKFKPLPLLPEGTPSLRTPLADFDFANPPVDPNKFASDLVETCKYYNGLGLSANQCGFPYRVFVAGYGNDYVAFFNPRILDTSEELVHMQEGCLSFPELLLSISRPSTVKVAYQDYLGETKEIDLGGLSARIFLHEFDHMNGVLFIDRAKPLALTMGRKKREKKMRERKKIMKKAIQELEMKIKVS
jgi:peptide deformylase